MACAFLVRDIGARSDAYGTIWLSARTLVVLMILVKPKQAQLVESVKQHVPTQVSFYIAINLFAGRVIAEVPATQSLLLFSTDLTNSSCLLAIVDPEASKKAR